MKRNRLILLGIWILSLVGISLKGGPVTYGFFAVATLVPVVLLIYLFVVFWQVKIYQKMDGRSQVCDQNTHFYFTLQNESILVFSCIRVTFFSNYSKITGLSSDTEYELIPHTGIELKTGLVCKYRGCYEVGVKNIIVTDFWNVFSLSFKNRSTLSAVVYPKVVHLNRINSSVISDTCARESTSNKNEADVFTREYVMGDDVRFMQWKASARTGKLMVREKIGEEQPGVAVIMDSCRYGKEPEEYLPVENKLLELNLALSCYLLTRNIPVNGYYMHLGKIAVSRMGNLNAFDLFYSEMCEFSFNSTNENRLLAENLRVMNELHNNHMIIMIIHKWSTELQQLALSYADDSIPVAVYLVSDEADALPEKTVKHRNIEFMQVRTDADLMEVLQ